MQPHPNIVELRNALENDDTQTFVELANASLGRMNEIAATLCTDDNDYITFFAYCQLANSIGALFNQVQLTGTEFPDEHLRILNGGIEWELTLHTQALTGSTHLPDEFRTFVAKATKYWMPYAFQMTADGLNLLFELMGAVEDGD